MPARSARARPKASGQFEKTAASDARPSAPVAAASMSACKFVPPPETNTTTRWGVELPEGYFMVTGRYVTVTLSGSSTRPA
jgi:hypothetical protein